MRTAIVANSHAGRDARCSSTARTTPPDRPPRRVRAAVAAALLSLVLAGTSAAGAQTGPDNLPPAPGVLERELSLPPLSKPDAAASGSGPRLTSPIEIPFILEGGHIIVEASINGGSPKPFMFDTGASNIITPDIAQPLHAPVVRTERTGGFGPQVTRADVIQVDRIAIGAAAPIIRRSRSWNCKTLLSIADRVPGSQACSAPNCSRTMPSRSTTGAVH